MDRKRKSWRILQARVTILLKAYQHGGAQKDQHLLEAQRLIAEALEADDRGGRGGGKQQRGSGA